MSEVPDGPEQNPVLALTPVGLMLSGWMLGFAGETTLAWIATGLMAVSTLAVLPIPGVLGFSDPKSSSDARPASSG